MAHYSRRSKNLSDRPKLKIFRSLKHICAIIINENGTVIASETDTGEGGYQGTKTDRAFSVGQTIAKRVQTLNLQNIMFDRSGYKYHGRVKALIEGAKREGLKL